MNCGLKFAIIATDIDLVRFEIKDERTRCIVSANPYGSNCTYNVEITIDGDGESVKSVVTLWGRSLPCGDTFVLFKTNAVLGTWKGR